VTDSANNPLIDDADQVPAGLYSLLASVVSYKVEQPTQRGGFKGAFNGQGIPLGMPTFGHNGWYLGPDGRDFIDIWNTVLE